MNHDERYTADFDDAGYDDGAAVDAEFERRLAAAVGELDAVPEPPRELMWARIDAARRRRRGGPVRRALHAYRPAIGMAAGLAAVLAVGIGIGRGSAGLSPATMTDAVTTDVAATAAATLPYRVAAVHHLDRTEALLTALPASAAGGDAEEVALWAGELLAQTRLLLDSPAGEDADLARLLQDLELLLAQVATLTDGRAEAELDLIRDGIDQNHLMLRLRTATAARPFAGT